MRRIAMPRTLRTATWGGVLLLSLLTACGGGSDHNTPAASSALPGAQALEAGAPQATGNTATDTYNWFNFRRRQAGAPSVARNEALDLAAQGHSNYQQQNVVITHDQRAGNPGFTGATLPDRLKAVGYSFTRAGEVLVATGNPQGGAPAEALLAAIFHRFIVLEPRFRDVGVGAATVPDGYTYVTADFAANGLAPALPPGSVIVYPFAGQQRIATTFYSDREAPDPVPDRDAVGYPVSVQAGLDSTLVVDSFTIAPHGLALLAVQLLTNALNSEVPNSAAAIIPLEILAPATTYDVQFVGSADGRPVSQSWSFTTQ
jgi:uncharacterized protein YkwD